MQLQGLQHLHQRHHPNPRHLFAGAGSSRRSTEDRDDDDEEDDDRQQQWRRRREEPTAVHSMEAGEGDEEDDNAPLDLSLPAGRRRRNRTFSGTDSDDSGGPGGDEKAGGKAAYKKSLMKRYCEYIRFFFPVYRLGLKTFFFSFFSILNQLVT